MYPMIIFPKEIVLVLLLIRFSLVECCGTFRFKTEDGVALAGHVISKITTNWPIKCHLECVNFATCMSVNTRQNEAGKTICEMNNSSKAANPQDMEPRPGYQYRQMTVSLILESRHHFTYSADSILRYFRTNLPVVV